MKYGITYDLAPGTKPAEYKKVTAVFEKRPGFEKIGETFWVVADMGDFASALLEVNRIEAVTSVKTLIILDIS